MRTDCKRHRSRCKNFDGKPFTGKTMAEYMAYHGAAIAALADLVKSILEEKEAVVNTVTP